GPVRQRQKMLNQRSRRRHTGNSLQCREQAVVEFSAHFEIRPTGDNIDSGPKSGRGASISNLDSQINRDSERNAQDVDHRQRLVPKCVTDNMLDKKSQSRIIRVGSARSISHERFGLEIFGLASERYRSVGGAPIEQNKPNQKKEERRRPGSRQRRDS